MTNSQNKGIYILIIHLDRDIEVKVGRLGTFIFQPGWYTYTGSALNGLEQRIARHRAREKILHWHIDYLLQYAGVKQIKTIHTDKPLECIVNAHLCSKKKSSIPIPKFGSSDCRCASHLLYWGTSKPRLGTINP
jgi:sugar fermentation stimulation protein A